MHATVGDRVVVRGHHLGEPERDAEILEVHGAGGTPPYVVRWADNGHVATYFPGPDARIDHLAEDDPATAGPAADPPVERRADPVRRDIVEGVTAVRADVARLREALARARGFGGDFVTLATAEVARGVAKVECEANVIWGEIRAAEADSVEAIRAALDDATSAIRTVVDELRVQANLGGAEADAAWRHAVAELATLHDDQAATVDKARAVADDVFRRLRAVVA
ncbi:MAG TPA: DUF1918 domain-containing protein [Frankiaceae bacterium]|nr:DUF1918 domain-containing protein [Frankiaceae bacterium]